MLASSIANSASATAVVHTPWSCILTILYHRRSGARAAAAAAAAFVVSRTASSSASIVVVVSRAPSSSASASGRSPPASARRGVFALAPRSVFALAPRSVIALSLLGSPRCASSDSEDTTDARARFLVTVAVRRVSFASFAAGAPRRVADMSMSARRSIPLPRVTTRHESPLVSTTNQSINPNTIAMGNESINRRASSSLVLLRARDLVVSTREIPETRSPSTRDARPRRVLARSRVARCRGMGVASAPARARWNLIHRSVQSIVPYSNDSERYHPRDVSR
jgi:hypothetical protein